MALWMAEMSASAGAPENELRDFVAQSVRSLPPNPGPQHAADVEGSYLLAETGFDYWALRDLVRRLEQEARAKHLDEVLSRSYGPYEHAQAKALRAARFRRHVRPDAPGSR
jgi:hypothetical protein